MKKFLLTAVFALVGVFAFSQERIAVFPFEDPENILTRSQSSMFYQDFGNQFRNINTGGFAVVPRQDVERLINIEMDFQLSAFSAREKTAEMNRVLNGTHILSGRIGRIDNRIMIVVSLYTYPELAILPGGVSRSVSNTTELFSVIPELVQEMNNIIAQVGRTQPGRIYQIGDTGPAGGIIFYDKGVFSDGWRYLEAAPVNTEWRNIEWANRGYPWNDMIKDIGSGKQKTKEIVEEYFERAAVLCVSLVVNGFSDWFLPSIEELSFMYINLKLEGRGNFSTDWYWSSSGSGLAAGVPYMQSFSDGSIVNRILNNGITGSVRAARAF